MGFVEAIMEASSLVREAKEKAAEEGRNEGMARGIAEGMAEGRAEGKAQGMAQGIETGREVGRAEGRVEEARRLLRRALQAKYPGLETMPEIDAITNVGVVELLLIREVLSDNDRNHVERAIRAAID
jgi:hypothetical protein